MTPERFRRIEELYHAAREVSPEQRDALLAGVEPAVRSEVELLLNEGSGESFWENLAAAPLDPPTVTALGEGFRLGRYLIESKLGQGGMGDVYRALDTRLGRTIAIKTTRDQFSARFEREARAISALNHPHICTLHDVGPNYLVMELVEGETLAARLKQGRLPVETVLLYGSQIAAALAEAHAKGIIHRDLKPGNIMIGKSGVKVLDFGLARIAQDDTLTASHAVMGTPAYMAPEQHDGKPADHRTDIYALGLVLYEMATGVRFGTQPARVSPRQLERIVSRCLEAPPDQRWQSAALVEQQLKASRPSKRVLYIGVAIALMVAVGAAVFSYTTHRPKLTAKDSVVLADFTNKTGDPVFDQTLRQGLAFQLEQSPYLRLISDQRVHQILGFMNKPPDTRLTPEVSREICERTGSAAVLEGSISSLGSQYILWLGANSCRFGDALAEEQTEVKIKEEVLGGLSRIAAQIRTRLGESLASVQELSTPLEQATTPSLDALKAYTAAKTSIYTQGGATAVPHLRQAIAIDPQFAMAHADLGFMSWNMGQTDLGSREVQIAYDLRNRVSDRERRYITMLYDRQVTGNLQKELQTLESWAQTYPRDPVAPGITSGWVAFGTGNYERGIRAAMQARRIDPTIPYPYQTGAEHNTYLERYQQASAILAEAAAHKLELPDMTATRYVLAFLQHDVAGMEREVARAHDEHFENEMNHYQALYRAQAGRMRQARDFWDQAIASTKLAGHPESAAIMTAAEGVCEAHFGNVAAARERAREALALAKGRDVVYAAAFALALSGDIPASQKLASDLANRFPEDTPVQFEYLPILQALNALSKQSPTEGLARLQHSVAYDLAMPGTAFFAKFGGMYTVYVRGQAYLAAGRPQDAAAEFQKILQHPAVAQLDPTGVLVHLQLGRAYAAAHDRTKAKDAYNRFLTLWKDADADLPLLNQAKAEYARL